ncbi:MAG: precorrin-8X methylmutase [Clostridia bacterium]|jgi:precorrin-8X/cobalt-precorrin-8 methylmutase|nr:MAG: precorrin-8X methylmutase [Clostridia bacterium]
MKTELERIAPMEIEQRSFEMITAELPHPVDDALAPIIKRVIHTTADFEYADTLCFSEGVLDKALAAIRGGATIVTDTTMAQAGINKRELAKYGGCVRCFIADEDVAEAARLHGTTRSIESMEKAAAIEGPVIFAIGNAPTALVRLYDMIQEKRIAPALVIGVPVGFVNVVQAKERIMQADVPYIVARGRKGGSNVAAAICNALIYMLGRE